MKGKPYGHAEDLDAYMARTVYPALFERLDSAFPEFGWERRSGHWTATKWFADFLYPVGSEQPDRLMVYPDRPYWIKVHGHGVPRLPDGMDPDEDVQAHGIDAWKDLVSRSEHAYTFRARKTVDSHKAGGDGENVMPKMPNDVSDREPDALAALDLQIGLAWRRLKHINLERDRELNRQIDWVLQPDWQDDPVSDRLVQRLDELVHNAERRLAELEAGRAAAMLARIESLFPEA